LSSKQPFFLDYRLSCEGWKNGQFFLTQISFKNIQSSSSDSKVQLSAFYNLQRASTPPHDSKPTVNTSFILLHWKSLIYSKIIINGRKSGDQFKENALKSGDPILVLAKKMIVQ